VKEGHYYARGAQLDGPWEHLGCFVSERLALAVVEAFNTVRKDEHRIETVAAFRGGRLQPVREAT